MTFSVVTIDGTERIRLGNDRVQIEVLPGCGARIWSIRHAGIEWLWRHPSVKPRPWPLGTGYDDVWAGGWEELFPNDAPGAFAGHELPDHGEWWSQPWQWDVMEHTPRRVSVRLYREGTVTRTQTEKLITLEDGAAEFRVSERITSRETAPLSFLLKEHLAVAAGPGYRLELPGGLITPVDSEFITRVGGPGPFPWPVARGRQGERVDLSACPPAGAERAFVYVSALPEGWCGVRDLRTGRGLRLHFPVEVFRFTWLFMTFGGWRGLYVVVLEPCTNMPKDLSEAQRRGTCARLLPGQTLDFSCDVKFF